MGLDVSGEVWGTGSDRQGPQGWKEEPEAREQNQGLLREAQQVSRGRAQGVKMAG